MMEVVLPYFKIPARSYYSLCKRSILTSRVPQFELCKVHSNLLRGAHQAGDPPFLTSSHLLVHRGLKVLPTCVQQHREQLCSAFCAGKSGMLTRSGH